MSGVQIPNEVAKLIRDQFIINSEVAKCFVVLFLEDWTWSYHKLEDAEKESCFRNNPGLLFTLRNCKSIPMVVFNGDNSQAIFGQLSLKDEPKKAKTKKGFGK